MAKTAMQELIERLEDYLSSSFNVAIPKHIKRESLEKEKQQIIDAVQYGVNSVGQFNTNNPKYKTPEDYYNQIFNQ